jgi:hypothetical protein
MEEKGMRGRKEHKERRGKYYKENKRQTGERSTEYRTQDQDSLNGNEMERERK